ncbi:TPA: hypothetical protein DF272_06300 [Candidatus Falkowbacteria bacterium]|nr:hypothetical protein [Candidatus Falkowbacteria bacterium]
MRLMVKFQQAVGCEAAQQILAPFMARLALIESKTYQLLMFNEVSVEELLRMFFSQMKQSESKVHFFPSSKSVILSAKNQAPDVVVTTIISELTEQQLLLLKVVYDLYQLNQDEKVFLVFVNALSDFWRAKGDGGFYQMIGVDADDVWRFWQEFRDRQMRMR